MNNSSNALLRQHEHRAIRTALISVGHVLHDAWSHVRADFMGARCDSRTTGGVPPDDRIVKR